MTAAYVEDPRLPLVMEMVDAAREERAATNPAVKEFWRGVVIGYATAFGHTNRDRLVQARNVWFSAPLPLEEIQRKLAPLASVLRDPMPVMHASGVRWGWKQATSEREDAAECTFCEERILTASDEHVTCRNHGPLCSGECRRTYCEARATCYDEEVAW